MTGAHSAYIESRIAGATPQELIAILYQAAQDAVREARRHLESGGIPERCRQISRAMEILLELRGSLDYAAGGELSERMGSLYEYMLQRLCEANLRQQEPPLAEVSALLATLSEAWQAIAAKRPPADELNPTWHAGQAGPAVALEERVWTY